jgi:hypothetical protein
MNVLMYSKFVRFWRESIKYHTRHVLIATDCDTDTNDYKQNVCIKYDLTVEVLKRKKSEKTLHQIAG